MTLSKYLLLACLLDVAACGKAQGHSGENHKTEPVPITPSRSNQISVVNELYVNQVKPIFRKKCFDCHSQHTVFPWYYKLPGLKTLLERDVKEGRKHIDMSNDFPFMGHGTPDSDLRAIEKVVRDGSMPPLRYKLLHLGSGLSREEEEIILKWTRESQERLQSTGSRDHNGASLTD